MNSTKSDNRAPGQIAKMMGIVFCLLVFGVYGLTWLMQGSLMYATTDLETLGRVVVPPKLSEKQRTESIFFAVAYNDCHGVTETISLGPKKAGKRPIPQKLLEIRECLGKLVDGQAVKIKLETRRQRMSGDKSWRLRSVGPCAFPHLPTHINAESDARCSWM